MTDIRRLGESKRWADVVIHRGVATWVEVADDPQQDVRGQLLQVFRQIDETLQRIGSDRTKLLTVMVHLADLANASTLNEVWDTWVPAGHLPVRACVQSGLQAPYQIEAIITAAYEGGGSP